MQSSSTYKLYLELVWQRQFPCMPGSQAVTAQAVGTVGSSLPSQAALVVHWETGHHLELNKIFH